MNYYFDNKVIFLTNSVYYDNRGLFTQTYDEKIESIIQTKFVQENISISKKNVLRGLHYQFEKPMGKLVQCIGGRAIDIVMDIRKNSNTYGQIEFFDLDSIEKILWIPEGFAHGFYSLDENTIIKYLCSSLYNKNGEGCINIISETLPIIKKLNINIDKLIISDKDRYSESFEDYSNHPKF